MNNILVTERHFPTDPSHPQEFDYVVTDIGEGKVFQTQEQDLLSVDHWASYGATDFRAPEVNGRRGWSTKAEVFSFGIIATTILDCRRFSCTFPPPTWVLEKLQKTYPLMSQNPVMVAHIIPQSLKDVLETCLQSDAAERPEIRPVVRSLDNTSMEFFSEDPDRFEKPDLQIEWTIWPWNETKVQGRRGVRTAPENRPGEETDEGITPSVDDEFADYTDAPDMD
jgi:hypothetical protein